MLFTLLELSCVFLTVFYSLLYFTYCLRVLDLKVPRPDFYIGASITSGLSIFFMVNFLPMEYFVPFLLMGILSIYQMMFQGTFLQHFFAAGFFTFHILSVKNLVYCIYSLSQQQKLSANMDNIEVQCLVISIAYCFTILVSYLFSRFYKSDDIAALCNSPKNLRMTVTILCILLLVTFGDTLTFRIPMDSLSVAAYRILLYIFLLAVFYILFHYFVRVGTMDSYHLESMEKQLQTQLRHYNSQTEYLENFRKLRHDYKNEMRGLSYLLEAGEYEKATDYMKQMQIEMQDALNGPQTYSNNLLLDAILQDAAKTCKTLSCKFQAQVFLDPRLSLSDLSMCTLFSNILNNALEAVEQLPKEKRFIEINSKPKGNNWLTIVQSNSFTGQIRKHGDTLETTKIKHSELHGIGTIKIRQIVESIQGSEVFFEPDVANHVFRLTLALHLTEGETSDKELISSTQN